MPQAANLALADAAATPVTHNLNPIQKDAQGVIWYEAATAGVEQIEQYRLGIRCQRNLNSKGTGRIKVSAVLQKPKAAVVGISDAGVQAPKQRAYIDDVRVEFTLDERSGFQIKKDLRTVLVSLLNNSAFAGAVDSNLLIYA